MLISHLNMTDFVFSNPQKSLYSEFGSREFQFLKAPSLCAIFIGTGHLYLLVYCILCILVPQQFIVLGQKRGFMLKSHLNMTDFVFSNPQKSLYSEFGSREFQFLKTPRLCPIFIGTSQPYLLVYCILCILVP